jgi:hypothetical protein
VNWQHLRAFFWLRWRLAVNQWRRGGALNAVLMIVLAVILAVVAVPLFFVCLAIGVFAFPKAQPDVLLIVWDALVLGFLFFWMIGLVAELQRTEALSLSKFLHLPVSVNGAFVINFVSSLVRLSLVMFVPVMLGLALGLVVAKGPAALAVVPLTVAFLLLVTAVTYQFQGWLAALMSNPRRRRTVVVVTTAVFVLIFQLPNLLRLAVPGPGGGRLTEANKFLDEMHDLERARQSGQIDQTEFLRRQEEASSRYQASNQAANAELKQMVRLVNLAVPLGWFPLGVMYAAGGNVWPALGATLAMGLVGVACLWRSYRTTVRLYQGEFTARKGAKRPTVAKAAKAAAPARDRLKARVPGLPEPVAAIALGGFWSLVRSPESKMMLMTPLILAAVFGSMVLRSSSEMSAPLRTLLAVGALEMSLFGALQLMANQFGFDRDGFRVYVLCSAPRRDILLGKNLAFLPLAIGMAGVLVLIIQVLRPLRWDHFVAMVPQFVAMYLTFCLLVNVLSIMAPMYIAAGSMKPSSPGFLAILLQVALVLVFFPLTQVPTLLPLGVEALLEWQGWTFGLPVYLLLSLAQCAVVVFVYRAVLAWQGDLLRSREQKILETVTTRAG